MNNRAGISKIIFKFVIKLRVKRRENLSKRIIKFKIGIYTKIKKKLQNSKILKYQ